MSSQKIINIYLKPRKALVLATVSCGIILGLFLWKFCNPDNINNGEVITEINVRSVRPGYGLHPKYLPEILGKKVNRDIEKGTRFTLDYIDF